MKKILIIEDNAEIRENTSELLQLRQYEVRAAENGREGFEMARIFQPDVVICDMMMPDSDGYEFLKLAKADVFISKIPIVFFSAGSPSPDIHRILIKVANGFLKKPFTEEELLQIIQEAITRRSEFSQ
ncbi:MAG TPA: response regulator [Flavisolibacter sp.]|jgi:CheY-like chemotaxis protein|nr:response regulator [Flavisolibacter sp.]